jgi:hypothetical protein
MITLMVAPGRKQTNECCGQGAQTVLFPVQRQTDSSVTADIFPMSYEMYWMTTAKVNCYTENFIS